MKITNLSFDQVHQFSNRDKAYQADDEKLRAFYKHAPELEAFKEIISLKQAQNIDRLLLSDTISASYQGIEKDAKVTQNIDLLKSKETFTIITAHQPSLMTGPLYFIYKICSTINLCNSLSRLYPYFNFVPVFVSGAEDHDFEEINHVKLYNNLITWEAEHNGEPVGRMSLEGIDQVLDRVSDLLREQSAARDLLDSLRSFKASSQTYGEFTHKLVNHLFGKHGLVFINMDQKAYKNALQEIIKEEILNSKSKAFVVDQQDKLKALGFEPQAHAREINFFYFADDGRRLRIEKKDDVFHILDSEIQFSEAEIKNQIEQFPERFSPNVIMRPIFQEFIIPNLAYIGGGGELAYWLERKTQFEAFNIPFPMLIRRNSALLIDHTTKKLLSKLDLEIEDTFQAPHELINTFLAKQSGEAFSLAELGAEIESIFKKIGTKVSELDKSLVGRVEAEKVKTIKSISGIESKLKKIIKQQSEGDLQKIEKLYDRLTPNKSLQERKNNVLEFLDKYDLGIIDQLIEILNPMDKAYKIIDLTEND